MSTFIDDVVQGPEAPGAVAAANPLGLSLVDSTGTIRRVLGLQAGVPYVRLHEEETFHVVAQGVAPAGDKSMISLGNTHASRVLRLLSLYLVNAQTTNVTGVMLTFDLRRFTTHTGGTDLTSSIEQADLNQAIPSDMAARTGATISGESAKLLKRIRWSSDEHGAGTLDQEGYDHGWQQTLPVWGLRAAHERPLVIRQNQGLFLKQTVVSTVGVWDIHMTFSVEAP